MSSASAPRPALRALTGVCVALAALAAMPSLAHANTVKSDNWSGFAAHKTGVSFRRASASWVQPTATCESGHSSYSAFWVGLGGYSGDADALEQIGTELDCSAAGATKMSAWYELVPKASRTIALTVSAGDHMSAAVDVVGSKVTLSLSDTTTKRSFTRTFTDEDVDVSSAEWIAEAPSECEGSGTSDCTTLPLTDFGTVDFSGARARTSTGVAGAITNSHWKSTELVLESGGAEAGPAGRGFVSDETAATATPTLSSSLGTAFSVAYTSTSTSGSTGTTTTGTNGGGTGTTGPGGPGSGGDGSGWPGGWSGDLVRAG